MCLNVIGSDRLKGQSLQFPKGIDGITTLQAGWSSVHALFSNGSVTGWGNNSHGQILENANKHGKFNMISAGSEHCLAVVNSEIVDGWGWGEHGNLGPERDTSSLREVYRAIQGEYIVAVYGGCANSWFVLRDKLHAKG
jgi:protein ATS1